MTATITEVDDLPVEELLTQVSADLEEINPETMPAWGRELFLGILLFTPGGETIIAVPAGQDPRQRETVIRTLLAKQAAGGQA